MPAAVDEDGYSLPAWIYHDAGFFERLYQKYLPELRHLLPQRQRLWTYFKLWPNVAFDIYPDQVDFMQ